MIDWIGLLWKASVVCAVFGGCCSLAAFIVSKRNGDDGTSRQKAHVIYLVSYILMSMSIFFMAFRGLLQ